MPEHTEFEEPEYEGPLYNQLLSGSNNIWTPGRVFERIFGIDSAVLAGKLTFWQQFGQATAPIGVALSAYRWHFLWRFINRRFRPFPTFNVNLLIQSKRPSFRFGINADYARHGIKGHYWQFKLTLHQQKILEKLEQKLGTNVLVVYACPAFHKFADLDRYITSGQIVEHSTFVKPSNLTGHKKWVFDQPGTTGLACSEITKFTDKPFEEQFQSLYSQRNTYEEEIPSEEVLKNLLFLENIALEICNEETEKNPYASAIIRRRNNIVKELNSLKQTRANIDAVKSFATFEIFASTLNLTWWTV